LHTIVINKKDDAIFTLTRASRGRPRETEGHGIPPAAGHVRPMKGA